MLIYMWLSHIVNIQYSDRCVCSTFHVNFELKQQELELEAVNYLYLLIILFEKLCVKCEGIFINVWLLCMVNV